MMDTCPRCGLELLGYNDECPGCGYILRRRAQTMTVEPPAAPALPPPSPVLPKQRRSALGLARDYFTFRVMIGPAVIRVIYVLGAVLGSIGIAAAILLDSALLSAVNPRFPVGVSLALALVAVFVYNVSWRVSCELLMVRYDMREHLVKLTEEGREK